MQIRRLKFFRLEVLWIFIIIATFQNIYRRYGTASDKSNVVNTLRKTYIQPPDTRKYNLSSLPAHYAQDSLEYGKGARTYIQLLFSEVFEKFGGFYIEAGALDGEFLSNTLYLEYFQNWTGLLIEPDPYNYQSLVEKHRKAWISNTCISTTADVKNISLVSVASNNQKDSKTRDMMIKAQTYNENYENKYETLLNHLDKSAFTKQTVTALCFPMEAYLEVLNITTVDLLSLDIQGGEFDVLKMLPWEKVNFKLIVVEIMDEDFSEEIIIFMKSKGFRFIHVFAEDYFFYNESDVETYARIKLIKMTEDEEGLGITFTIDNEAKTKFLRYFETLNVLKEQRAE